MVCLLPSSGVCMVTLCVSPIPALVCDLTLVVYSEYASTAYSTKSSSSVTFLVNIRIRSLVNKFLSSITTV